MELQERNRILEAVERSLKADDFLKRYIDIEAYADGEAEKALELLEECEGDLDDIILSVPDYHTKAAVSEAESEIKKRTSALSTALSALAIGAAVGVAAKQAKWLSKLYGFDKAPEDFNSFVKFTPYNGKDTIQSAADRLARSVRTAYSSAVRSAWAFGGSSEGAVETAGRQKKSFENSVMSDFETSIPSFAKFADRRTYEMNSERIRGYRCCATLDGRTCVVCGEYHSMFFTDRSKAPDYPLHNRCRCVLIAELEGEPDTELPTYQEFIDGLSDEEQREVLGKTRYELYKNGEVKLDQFVKSGRKLRLDELDVDVDAFKENQKTAELVKAKYPNEEFVKRKVSDTSNLYVTKNRIKDGMKDPLVYNSDKMMAVTLAKETGKDVYLLSERGVGVKNPDGFFDIATIEMKHVTGDLDKLGKNAIRALKQSENIFLYADKNFTKENCIRKIRGSLLAKQGELRQKGEKFIPPDANGLVYIYTNKELLKLTWREIL